MTEERNVAVEEKTYCVVISDDQETLLAARAAGRVPVGLLGEKDLSAARYLIETMDTADEQFLERVVRRELGLPWIIGESDRLILREFTMEDLTQIPQEPGDQDADRVFYTPDSLEAYIRGQYGFFEYGLWAVVRKEDGRIMGKAGVVGAEENPLKLELGYHIFLPYRRRGYAQEACRMILDYVTETYECPVYAVTEDANRASRCLLEKLGFELMTQKYNGSEPGRCRYEWCCL